MLSAAQTPILPNLQDAVSHKEECRSPPNPKPFFLSSPHHLRLPPSPELKPTAVELLLTLATARSFGRFLLLRLVLLWRGQSLKASLPFQSTGNGLRWPCGAGQVPVTGSLAIDAGGQCLRPVLVPVRVTGLEDFFLVGCLWPLFSP